MPGIQLILVLLMSTLKLTMSQLYYSFHKIVWLAHCHGCREFSPLHN